MAVQKDRNALIAQLDRASGYGPEGREFESSSARQPNAGPNSSLGSALFFYLSGSTASVSFMRRVYVKDNSPFLL